ncbi:hypothetical protein ACFFRR_001344 [Megaselia abdita]
MKFFERLVCLISFIILLITENYGTSTLNQGTDVSSAAITTLIENKDVSGLNPNYSLPLTTSVTPSTISTSLLQQVTPSSSTSTNIQADKLATHIPILTTESTYEDAGSSVEGGHEFLGEGPDKKETESIQKGLDWLKEKRATDFGWLNDTHMVILSKELSAPKEIPDVDEHLQTIQDLEDSLSKKEMEIEILSMLDRHHNLPKPVNLDRLARYVLALGSLCKDPKRFYGHDLVALLQHHEPTQDNEFALTTLAACSSAAHVRKRQIRRLLDIASGVTDQSIDTIAMVILALRCIVTDHRHRHLQHFVRRPAKGLASLQDPRGGFGTLRSTALAIQALQELEPETWNRTAASNWLINRQRDDGSWTEEPIQDGQDPNIGIGLTADVILALGWKGLGAVRALQCDHVIRGENSDYSENGETKLLQVPAFSLSTEESDIKNVSYTYTLWVGTNVTEVFSLSLTSPKNTSFFKAMTQAAELDSRFVFEAREWPNGHYVHTLAGKNEEPRG